MTTPCGRRGVDVGEQLAFELEVLGSALLHELRAREGGGQVGLER